MPFSYSVDNGIDTRLYFGLEAPEPARPGCPDKVPAYLLTDPVYLNGEEEKHDDEEQKRRRSGGGDDRNLSVFENGAPGARDECVSAAKEKPTNYTFYQMFHPSVDSVRISIPMAHIYGKTDPWRSHSMDLVHLCRDGMAVVYEHSGGHVVPNSVEECEGICEAVETVVASIEG